MPSQDAKEGRRLSRRSLLQGAATAGAAGLAATAIGAAGPALAATSSPQAADQSPGRSPGQPHRGAPAGPIMVHVRDTRSGDIEVFAGTSQTRLRDTDLAARIARSIG
jgi:nitrous oxide reductase